MREFPGGGGNFRFDRFEHGAESSGAHHRNPAGFSVRLFLLIPSPLRPLPGLECQQQENQQHQQIGSEDDSPHRFYDALVERRCR